ncbi:anaerobic benzoate catabolism transcriptional regulator [Planctopirus ephydatiae]|jgi:transcriptional regulator with XRE-family HTH domain|uniref:Anaerobic benzoate catabolism transcriptional regulator n=2 Tax=Planctopirus ephydatiae TaxID=2528019 RepID=A0A518GP04_9PLAN|nr:anaerobic benzoate catabolism transcriptional regulator [Planctopirus ephydatiae]
MLSKDCKHPTILGGKQQPAATTESEAEMTFGERVRELRHAKGWSLRVLAEKVDVGFTYLSRVENGRLNFGDYPSDALIHRLADALEADEEELTVLAERVPERIRRRVLQRPDVFGALANCDDKTLDKLMTEIGKKRRNR